MWVDNGFCFNYFVRENNMFYGKLDEEVCELMFMNLLEMYGEGWWCLLWCLFFKYFREVFIGVRI